jgi:hypothetical protein
MADEAWYTCKQLAAKLVPGASEWAHVQVAVALGMLTRWHMEHGELAPVIDRNALAKEVRRTNKTSERLDHLIGDLGKIDFQCQWILYASFEVEAPGFVLDNITEMA